MSEIIITPLGTQPIVIIGSTRSGTKMLLAALTKLDGLETWPCDEINYIWRHGWATYPTDELRPEHATPRVIRYIRAAFIKLARRTNARCVVEKTCPNSLRVEFVRAVLPEARFIFIVRDGRDAAASAVRRCKAKMDLHYLMKKLPYVPLTDLPWYAVRYAGHRIYRLFNRERRPPTWGPRFEGMDQWLATRSLAEVCAEQWRQCVVQADAALSDLPDERLCRVRYETLVTQPEQELGRLSDWLQAPVQPGQLRRISEGIWTGSVGKSLKDFSATTLSEIEPIIMPTLRGLHGFPECERPRSAA